MFSVCLLTGVGLGIVRVRYSAVWYSVFVWGVTCPVPSPVGGTCPVPSLVGVP